jgi:hypothetical protein
MKPTNLLIWTLLGLLVLPCGCARSILQSSPLPVVMAEKASDLNMVYSLPKGMIHFKRETQQITVETVYGPDPEKYYTLAYLPRSSFEETVNVSLTSDLLLSQIEVTSKPKIGEIFMKVFELAREIAKLPITTAMGPEVKLCDVMIDPELLLNIKPSQTADLEQSAKLLRRLEDDVKAIERKGSAKTEKDKEDLKRSEMEIRGLKSKLSSVKSLADLYDFCGIEKISLTRLFPSGITQAIPSPSEGVKYRPLLPYRLVIKLPDHFFDRIIYLPNEAPVITLDVTRPFFADRITKLGFEKGVLTRIDLTRPSETLAFVTLPVELVKAIVGLPLDLIKFRVENIQESNRFLEAQVFELQQRQALLQQRQALWELQQQTK